MAKLATRSEKLVASGPNPVALATPQVATSSPATPRSQKETEILTSWNPLKSCRMPLTVIKRENYPQLGIAREFHNSKEIHRRITCTSAAPSNSFSKDNEKSQPQPQKKGRSSITDSGDENRTLMHERDCFRSHLRTACMFVMLE